MAMRTTLLRAAAVLLPSSLCAQAQCLYMPRHTLNLNTGTAPIHSLTLSQDELTIVFASTLAGGLGGYDLWQCTRANLFAPWSMPVNLTVLNTSGNDWEPCLSFDGAEILFTRSPMAGPSNILTATRGPMGYGPPQPIPGMVNGPGLDNHDPYLTADRLTLFYAVLGMSGFDIYTATRANTSTPWTVGTPFVIANSPFADRSPMPEGDGGVVFFASDRPGGVGRLDFYMTWRSGTAWAPPIPVTEANTPDADLHGHHGVSSGGIYCIRSPLMGPSRGDDLCPCPNPMACAGRAASVRAWPLTGGSPPVVKEYIYSAAIGSTLVMAVRDWRVPPPPPPPEIGFLFLGAGFVAPPPYLVIPGLRGGWSILPPVMIGSYAVDPALRTATASLAIPNDPSLIGTQVSLQMLRLELTASLSGSCSHIGGVAFR